MTNTDVETLLFSYFSGQLTEAEEIELADWLNEDEGNKKVFSELADWWAITHVPYFMSDKGLAFKEFFDNVINRETKQEKNFFNVRTLSGIAASLLVMLTVGISSYYWGKSTSHVEQDVNLSYYETEVPMGSQSKVILPDRSVVWINAGSSLKYHEDIKQNQREVTLNGEAYFEVAPDSMKPFIVKTEKLEIKVLGTSFNVKSYDDDEIVDIALLTGKIDVGIDTEVEEMIPDQLLSFNKKTNEKTIVPVSSLDYCAWKDGSIRFTEYSFIRIAKDLERVYNVEIEIRSDLLKEELFTGSFTKNHTFENILNEIDMDKKYTWTKHGNKYIIRDK